MILIEKCRKIIVKQLKSGFFFKIRVPLLLTLFKLIKCCSNEGNFLDSKI